MDSTETEMEGRWFKFANKAYVLRRDQRKVEEMAVIDVLAQPRPRAISYKYDMAGAKELSKWELSVIDVEKRKVLKINADKWQDQDMEVLYTTKKGDKIFFERYKRKRMRWNFVLPIPRPER